MLISCSFELQSFFWSDRRSASIWRSLWLCLQLGYRDRKLEPIRYPTIQSDSVCLAVSVDEMINIRPYFRIGQVTAFSIQSVSAAERCSWRKCIGEMRKVNARLPQKRLLPFESNEFEKKRDSSESEKSVT